MCRKAIVMILAIASVLGNKAIATQYAFQVSFTDKNNTPYSLSSPGTYLSPRALSRRTLQGIAIDSTDLPVTPAYIDSVLTLTGGKLHEASKWLNLCVVLVDDSAQILTLQGKPFIKDTRLVGYYSPDSLHKPAPPPVANPLPAYKTTSGAADASYYGTTWDQTALVNGYYLYDGGYTGEGKLIAVLDAGFPSADMIPALSSLWSSGRVTDQHNFTLATDFVLGYDGHGTKVLSTMAGYVPNTFVGSAPMASYALYISEDGFSEQPIELINMLCASERADSIGADIITSSLGYNTFDNPADDFVFATDFDGKSTIAAKAANMATKKGMLFVASAGNEGGDSWNNVLTPGDADSALTIGSVYVSGVNAGNSGYGPNAAGQVKPDVCAMGQQASVCYPDGTYENENGTSFSTPQVAGWAACLWQSYPGATPFMIRQAIIKCASFYHNPSTQIGYGIPNFQCSMQELLSVIDTFHTLPSAWITVAPNPFGNDLIFHISPDTDEYVNMALIDVTGKIIAAVHQQFYKNINTPVSLSVPGLQEGVYILKATSATKQQVIRLEKL